MSVSGDLRLKTVFLSDAKSVVIHCLQCYVAMVVECACV